MKQVKCLPPQRQIWLYEAANVVQCFNPRERRWTLEIKSNNKRFIDVRKEFHFAS